MDFCPFYMSKNIGKNISKSLSCKYSQKLLDHAKKFATDALKTASKRAVPKTAEATGDLIGNKISDKMTKVSRSSPQDTLEPVESETKNIGFDREILEVNEKNFEFKNNAKKQGYKRYCKSN